MSFEFILPFLRPIESLRLDRRVAFEGQVSALRGFHQDKKCFPIEAAAEVQRAYP